MGTYDIGYSGMVRISGLGDKSIVGVEAVSYGVGTLLPTIPEPSLFEKAIASLGRTIPQTIDWQYPNNLKIYGYPLSHDGRAFASTNVILGDAYGELEQLRRRSQETDFIEDYFKYVQHVCRVTNSERHPFFKSKFCRLKHRKSGLWVGPPESSADLIDRANFILENTIVENPRNPAKRQRIRRVS